MIEEFGRHKLIYTVQISLVKGLHKLLNNGLVVLPARPCSGDFEVVASADQGLQNLATVWRIAFPQSGQLVNGTVTVSGTANFQSNTQGYYEVELGISADGGETRWIPVGGRRSVPVVNGQLAVLDASTLTPGSYYLRLSITQNGRVQGDPYVVSFRVGGVEAAQASPGEGPVEDPGRVVDVSKVVNPSPEQQPQAPAQPAPPVEDNDSQDSCASLSGCD